MGAATRRNHAGGPSSPAAVGFRLSSMWNTFHSLTYSSGVSHRSPTASGSGRHRADHPRLFSSKRRFRMNAEQRSLNLSNLRVLFREYPREIAVVRSFFSAQKAANIVQRPGSAWTRWGSLQRSPRLRSWIKWTFGISHRRSCFAKRSKNVASKMQLMYSV